MSPSERVQGALSRMAQEGQQVGPQEIFQLMLQVMDEEYQRSRWLERRLLELILMTTAKSGIPIPQELVLALRDLRGRSRLAVPGGDPLLDELCQVIVGEAQQEARVGAHHGSSGMKMARISPHRLAPFRTPARSRAVMRCLAKDFA